MMMVMRYPQGHKEAVHETIVKAAARALRDNGLSGVGIPALMKGAGLTHGGFYTHFRDRDALVAEAVQRAGAETAKAVFADGTTLDEALERYLSAEHVDHPGRGCVVAALAAESPRQSTTVRRAFGQVVRGLISLVDKKLHAADQRDPTDAALRLTATMVGAVILARAVDDRRLAERILNAARAG